MRLCKALDALDGFGGFSSLWQVWKALGSFDVNMVCPLPGSWINHVSEPRYGYLKMRKVFFPGKGLGPGFSFSCRPSALDRSLNLRARRIFCNHFYRVL